MATTILEVIDSRLSEISNLKVCYLYNDDETVTDKFCEWEILNQDNEEYLNGLTTISIKTITILVDLYCKTKNDLVSLEKSIKDKLSVYTVINQNITVELSKKVNWKTAFDNDNKMYHSLQEFEIKYREA